MNDQHRQRKQQLLAQVALHRQQLQKAQQAVAHGFRPHSVAKGAAGSLALAALAWLKNRKHHSVVPAPAPTAGIAAMLPLAIKTFSLLGRAAKGRPIVRKVLIVGASGMLAALAAKLLMAQRRTRRK